MSSFEFNKVFAAVLSVGILIMLIGFVSDSIFVSEKLSKDAVSIEGASTADGHGSVVASAPKLPDPIMGMLADADIERGKKLSKACAACHSFEKGGPTKQGPNLWGMMGKKKASISGFSYSDALKSFGGSWGYDDMNKFLAKPKKYVPGTKMNFAGLKKAKDRAAMIAWLRTMSDSQIALPSAAEIAAEEATHAPPPVEEAPADAAAPAEDGHH